MNFKDQLLRLRKENNLSQEELAEKLGVSRQAISKWETGTASPELSNLTALCELFGVTPNAMLGYEKEVCTSAIPDKENKMQWWKILLIATIGLLLLSTVGRCLFFGLFTIDPDSGNASTDQSGPELLFDAEFVSIDSLGCTGDIHNFRLAFRTQSPVEEGQVVVSVFDTTSGKFKEYDAIKNGVYYTAEIPVSFRSNVIISAAHKLYGEIVTGRELIQITDADDKGYSHELR